MYHGFLKTSSRNVQQGSEAPITGWDCLTNHCKEANHGRSRDHLSNPDTGPAFGVSAAVTDAGRVARPRRIADPEGINPKRTRTTGDGEMMLSSVVRRRAFGSPASAGAVAKSGGEAQANSAGEAQLTPGPSRGSTLPLAELEAEARYARERYELYRARAYGPRLTSAGRLRELERRSKMARRRLDRARADRRPLAPDGASGIGGRGR